MEVETSRAPEDRVRAEGDGTAREGRPTRSVSAPTRGPDAIPSSLVVSGGSPVVERKAKSKSKRAIEERPPSHVHSADLEQNGLVSEERIAKLRARWGIPASDGLVRVMPCVYRKPRPSHGKMYIFPNHLVFLSHSHHTNVCILFSDVQQMMRKRHRIHLVTAEKTHRLRGAITQVSTTYGILLAVWQHARGDKSIDLESIRATDKRVQKALKKAERRGSADITASGLTETITPNSTSEMLSDSGSEDEDDSEEEAEAVLESHTITDKPKWEIPLSPLEAAPPGFSAMLKQPEDAQNANKFEAVLPATLERCWNLLYSTSSPFITQTMGKFGCSGVTVGDWTPDETEAGVYIRRVSYTKPMQGAMMKGDCHVEQTQRMIYVTQPSKKVLMFQEAKTQGPPFCDSFVAHAAYELYELGEQQTRIINNTWVFWTKSPPRLLRGKIERGTVSGAEESFKKLMAEAEAALTTETQTIQATSPAPKRSPKTGPCRPSASGAAPAQPAPASVHAATAADVTVPQAATTVVVSSAAPTTVAQVPIAAQPNAIQINPVHVYAILGVLLLSILTNILLAILR